MSVASWASDAYEDYGFLPDNQQKYSAYPPQYASQQSFPGKYDSQLGGVIYGTQQDAPIQQAGNGYMAPGPVEAPKDIRGVGITFEEDRSQGDGATRVFVRKIRPGSSAAQCGNVQEGDTLISVNDQNVFGQPLTSLRNLVPGPANTPVKLGLLGRTGKKKDVELIRTTGRDGRATRTSYEATVHVQEFPLDLNNTAGFLSEAPSIAIGDEASTYMHRIISQPPATTTTYMHQQPSNAMFVAPMSVITQNMIEHQPIIQPGMQTVQVYNMPVNQPVTTTTRYISAPAPVLPRPATTIQYIQRPAVTSVPTTTFTQTYAQPAQVQYQFVPDTAKTLQYVTEPAPVQYVTEQAPVQYVREQVPVQYVTEQAPVQYVAEQPNVHYVTEQTPVQYVSEPVMQKQFISRLQQMPQQQQFITQIQQPPQHFMQSFIPNQTQSLPSHMHMQRNFISQQPATRFMGQQQYSPPTDVGMMQQQQQQQQRSTAVGSMPQQRVASGGGSDGWEMKQDPSGFQFWVNHVSKKISYTPPSGASSNNRGYMG